MKLKYIDPRHIQIFNNVSLMVYSYFYLNFTRSVDYLIPTLILSLLLDYILSHYFNPERDSRSLIDRLTSIFNTTAAVYIMVNVDSPLFYLLAITFGIASKFIFRIGNQHLFNPANIGIVLSLLFINDTYIRIIYSQFALSSQYLFYFVVINGLIITIWANRLVLALSYFVSSLAVLYLFSPYFGYSRQMLMGPTLSISSAVFIFFMITDPKTTPTKWSHQIIFGFVCAIIGAVLRMNQLVHDAFIAYFLTTGLYTIFRYNEIVSAEKTKLARS